MSKVYFISDLHLGHKRILEIAGSYRGGTTVEEHDEWIVEQWNSVVTKRDKVFLLGDVCFDSRSYHRLSNLNGNINLCMGNHDRKWFDQWKYHLNPKEVFGFGTYEHFWLSHCPIHPSEFRGRYGNIHGHLHHNLLPDEGYINVCVEQCYGVPICYDEIREKLTQPVETDYKYK